MLSIKTQIVFPEDLLQELDRAVKKRERSDFVVQAVQEKLRKLKLEKVVGEAAGIWKDHPDFQTDAQVRKHLERLRGADTGRVHRIRKAWHG
ncbi:MAG TPA: ribbon-helix-helix domain-containing protein [Acidobacteriota bacterium]|nr:ribbon-helix-helix domain-containing protein [Acidobacteriota bacterium]